MTEAQGTELLNHAANLYLTGRILVVLLCLSLGASLFLAYKMGRKP